MKELVVELSKGFGKLFINPLLFWIILFSFLISRRRIKDEQLQFGRELSPLGAEFSNTWKLSVFGTLLASVTTIVLQTAFAKEIILFLSIILFILSFSFGFRLLSAVYSLGFTYVFLKILQMAHNQLFQLGYITSQTFSTIALLIAIFLLIEVMLYQRVTNETAFPELVKSGRGSWVGLFHIQKASFVPFFVPVQSNPSTSSITLLPDLTIAGETYSFILIPFIIGFHHVVKGHLPETKTAKLIHYNRFLSLLVFIIATASFYLPGLASFAIIVALLGKIFIQSSFTKEDKAQGFYFIDLKKKVTIFAIVPNSPAARLGFKVGDTIIKVNNRTIEHIEELEEEWKIGTPTSFEIIDKKNKLHTIKNTEFYSDFDSFGFIFIQNRRN